MNSTGNMKIPKKLIASIGVRAFFSGDSLF